MTGVARSRARRFRSAVAVSAVAAAAVAGGLNSLVHASTITWSPLATDGMWGSNQNWIGGQVPTADDVALFNEFSSPPAIDLGGQVREASFVRIEGGAHHSFGNGALRTNGVGAATWNVRLEALGSLLNLANVGTSLFGGGIGDGNGGGDFSVATGGIITSACTYTGSTLVATETVLREAGAIQRSSSIQLGPSRSLTIDNSIGDPRVDRLPDTAPLVFSGDVLSVLTHASIRSVETVGDIVLDGGGAVFNISYGGVSPPSFAVQTIDAASLHRQPGATLRVTALAGSTVPITFRQVPQMSGVGGDPTRLPILPYVTQLWAANNPTLQPSFATYDTGADPNDPSDDIGLRPLNLATEFAPAPEPGAPMTNVRILSAQSLAASSTVNSLTVLAPLTLSDNAELTIASGGLMLTTATPASANTIITGNGRLTFPNEGIIFSVKGTNGQPPYTVDVPISAQRLTVGGTTPLLFTRPSSPMSALNINGPILISGAQGAIPAGATILITDGGLGFARESQSYDNPIRLGSAFNAFAEGPEGVRAEFDVEDGIAATLGGDISGDGRGIAKSGGGLLRIDGAILIDHVSAFEVSGGTLQLNGPIAVGARSSWDVRAGTLELNTHVAATSTRPTRTTRRWQCRSNRAPG